MSVRPGVVVIWLGLAVVLVAAAVLSFVGLRDLAVSVGIAPRYAWLLPIVIDAGAAVSCAAWLSGWVHQDAARFARAMTWALLGVTVVGQGAHLGMHANGVDPHWLVAVAVGAVIGSVVGGSVHLAVLVVRGDQPPAVASEAPDEVPDLLERARALVADGAGRPRVRDELGVSDYRARKLLELVATNGQVTP